MTALHNSQLIEVNNTLLSACFNFLLLIRKAEKRTDVRSDEHPDKVYLEFNEI